jgi:hypothetical protein
VVHADFAAFAVPECSIQCQLWLTVALTVDTAFANNAELDGARIARCATDARLEDAETIEVRRQSAIFYK